MILLGLARTARRTQRLIRLWFEEIKERGPSVATRASASETNLPRSSCCDTLILRRGRGV